MMNFSLAAKGTGIVLILIVLMAGLTAAVGILSFNQHTMVSAEPTVDIETIDFGIIFPGMTVGDSFTVSFTELPSSPMDYTLTLDPPETGFDLIGYLLVTKDAGEGETETDPQAGGADTQAIGTVTDPGDLADKWLVTLNLPDELPSGDYGTRIKISYPEPPLPD